MALSPLTRTVTVEVARNGSVVVESGSRLVAMSRWSERAARLADAFGTGLHVVATDADVEALSPVVAADLADALAV